MAREYGIEPQRLDLEASARPSGDSRVENWWIAEGSNLVCRRRLIYSQVPYHLATGE